MLVTRDGDDTTFWVNDCPQTANHRFWQDYFASGTWEAFTLDTIDTYVTPDSTYVDIGAWVGPTVLWAARRGGRVVAVEPDPVARDTLTSNVYLNDYDDRVTVVPAAFSYETGTARLVPRNELGDSMSRLGVGDRSIEVDTISADDLFGGLTNVSLVKIDIEGGEGVSFPAAADRLHALDCPILLSLHLDWIEHPTALLAAIDTFDVTVLDNTVPAFRTLLLTNP
jgi:FkbM family methyltransferase